MSILFFTLSTLWAGDENQDNYGNIADYLKKTYGIDSNAGLTAFPVLKIPIGGRSEGMPIRIRSLFPDMFNSRTAHGQRAERFITLRYFYA